MRDKAGSTDLATARRASGERSAGFARGQAVEIGAGLVLALGVLLGIVVWARWGFLVAFDAVVTYCFG